MLGGTGKTGRRIVDRLSARGLPVRVGSRAASIPFAAHRRDVNELTSPRLMRQPRDFGDYVRDTVATGVWAAPAADRVR